MFNVCVNDIMDVYKTIIIGVFNVKVNKQFHCSA